MSGRAAWVVVAAAVAVVAASTAGIVGSRSGPRMPDRTFTVADRPPPGAVARIGSPVFGPVGGHNSELLALSHDGTRLYTCDDEGVLRAWDVDRAAPLWHIEPHPDWVPPDVRTLRDRIRAIEFQFQAPAYRETPRDLEASPDGRYVATCAGAMVRAFDASTGAFVGETTSKSAPQQLVWTADGASVAWCDDGRVVVWDVLTGSVRSSAVLSSHWFLLGRHPGGSLLVATMEPEKRTRLIGLSPETLDEVALVPELPEEWGPVMVFDRRGRLLLHRVERSPLRNSWGWLEPQGGEVEMFLPAESPSNMLVFAATRAEWVTTPSLGGRAALALDGDSGRLLLHGEVRGVAFSADGRRAAVAEYGHARIFDAPSGRFLRSPDEVVSPYVIAPLPDGRRVLVVSCERRVLECDIETGEVLRRFELPSRRGAAANADFGIRVSPDGGVAAGYRFRIDLGSGAVHEDLDAQNAWISLTDGIGFHGGTTLRVCPVGPEPELRVVRFPGGTGAPLAGMTGVQRFSGSFRFHADGTTVFGRIDEVAHEWDTRTGEELAPEARRAAATGPVPAASPTASSAGTQAASSAGASAGTPRPPVNSGYRRRPSQHSENGKTVTIEDELLGETYVRLAEPVPFDGEVAAVDDEIAALGRCSGEILLLRRSDGARIGRIAGERAVVALAFVPGGRRLLAGQSDGTIVVWDLGAALGGK